MCAHRVIQLSGELKRQGWIQTPLGPFGNKNIGPERERFLTYLLMDKNITNCIGDFLL